MKYCNPHHGTAIPVVTALDRFHADMLELWGISLSRDLLEQICQAFYKVSGDTLEKYNKLFIPAPFTWITFEQFGGLIKNKSNFSVIIGALTPPIPGDEHECKKRLYHSAVTRLGNEVKHTNEIIARAVPDIVAIDIPILKKFIEQVIGELRAKRQDSAIRPISLLNIQALTQRIIDNQTYENILSLLQFADHSIYFSDDVSISFGDQSKHSVDLLSPMGRHAALRLLQRLGEYMTGKNLSSCFDDTIPWEDVVALRNIIVHQDQNKNKRFVDDLLKNKEQLETIFKEEFTELFFRLLDNLLLREQNTSTYEMNPQEHWTKIYQLQQQKALAQAAPNQGKKEALVSLTSQEDEDFFIAKLKEKGATEELQDLWRGILRGTEKSPLTSVEEGKFRQKYFPSRKEDPVSCKRLTEIMRNALRPRLNKEERNKKQVQIKEEANQRELEKKNKICGLKTIRSLVEHAKTSQEGGHILSVSERVNAVIEALNNMKQFLFKVGYINYHAAYTTLEGWDAFHMRFGGLTLTNTLLVNHQLRDALEYNFGQAIQHLEKIQGFKVFNNCSYLRQNYPRLRELRNYVEHDNALMATVYSDNSIPFINRITLNEHILYSEYISVIYKLLPELRLVQLERLTSVDRTGNEQNNTSLPVSRLTSSPRSAASSVGSNRFFGAAEQEESEKEKEGYTHTP